MLVEAFRGMGDGVYIQSRQSADLFNVYIYIYISAQEIQRIVDAFSDASKKFGLKINIIYSRELYIYRHKLLLLQ